MENVTVLELIVHVLRLSLISQNIACPFLGEFICQFVSFSCSVPRSTHLSSLERYNPTGNLRSECCRLLLWPAKNYVCTQLYGACKPFWHNLVTHPIYGLTWWSSSILSNLTGWRYLYNSFPICYETHCPHFTKQATYKLFPYVPLLPDLKSRKWTQIFQAWAFPGSLLTHRCTSRFFF